VAGVGGTSHKDKKVAGCVKVVCINVISEVIRVHHYLVCSVSCILLLVDSRKWDNVARLCGAGRSGE